MSTNRTTLLRPFIIAPLLCLLYALAVVLIRGKGDSYMLVTLGSDRAPFELAAHTYSEEGYDGQFAFYIAYEGVTSPYLDAPAYRAQRIFLPALAGWFSFGQRDLIPLMLLLVNLIALGGGTLILETLLREYNLSRWYALGYGLSLGVFGAARLATTETLAYALVLGGIWMVKHEHLPNGAAIFAVAALTKEMTFIFPAAYGIYLLYKGRWPGGLAFGASVLIPFIIWQLYLHLALGEFGVGSGGDLATSFEVIPFMGFFRILTEGGASLFVLYMLIVGPFVIVPTLWGLWEGLRALLWRQKEFPPELFLLVANAGLLLFVPFSTYREFLGILRFVVGLQIAIILYAAHIRQHRALRYSTLYAVTTLFVIVSDFSGG